MPTLQSAIEQCTDASGVIEKCGVFDLRTDEDMAACKVLPRVNEPVAGVLAALPGCNPIQPGPGPAVMQQPGSCGAATEIGDPLLPYTDVSGTRGWRYVGCVKDPAGQARTLGGAQEDQPGMTVDVCVKFCEDKGFAYAGVEFKTQCFCGTGVAPDRMPTNGTTGECGFQCAGDPKQICGGYGQANVYQKCDSGADCKNAVLG